MSSSSVQSGIDSLDEVFLMRFEELWGRVRRDTDVILADKVRWQGDEYLCDDQSTYATLEDKTKCCRSLIAT